MAPCLSQSKNQSPNEAPLDLIILSATCLPLLFTWLPLFQLHWPSCYTSNILAYSCLRAFTLAVSYSWNILFFLISSWLVPLPSLKCHLSVRPSLDHYILNYLFSFPSVLVFLSFFFFFFLELHLSVYLYIDIHLPLLFSVSFCVYVCVLSHVQLCPILWTIAHQTPLSMWFSRQEYLNGLPCFPPGALLHPGIKPVVSLKSPTLAGRFFGSRFPLISTGKPLCLSTNMKFPQKQLFLFSLTITSPVLTHCLQYKISSKNICWINAWWPHISIRQTR